MHHAEGLHGEGTNQLPELWRRQRGPSFGRWWWATFEDEPGASGSVCAEDAAVSTEQSSTGLWSQEVQNLPSKPNVIHAWSAPLKALIMMNPGDDVSGGQPGSSYEYLSCCVCRF
jgi:hypothetical protein